MQSTQLATNQSNIELLGFTSGLVITSTSVAPKEAAAVASNSHIVIPMMAFVFGFPALVIGVLCLIQQRNKCLIKRQMELHAAAPSRSGSATFFTGVTSSNAGSLAPPAASHYSRPKSYSIGTGAGVASNDSCTFSSHKNSILVQQNQRARKLSLSNSSAKEQTILPNIDECGCDEQETIIVVSGSDCTTTNSLFAKDSRKTSEL